MKSKSVHCMNLVSFVVCYENQAVHFDNNGLNLTEMITVYRVFQGLQTGLKILCCRDGTNVCVCGRKCLEKTVLYETGKVVYWHAITKIPHHI